VAIAYVGQEASLLPLGKSVSDSPFIVPISFEWKNARGEVTTIQANPTREGLNLAGSGETMPAFFFSSGVFPNAVENATRFSELDTQGKSHIVAEALRSEFPTLKDISIQIISGMATLHASLTYSDLKIPLGLLSGGINKLMSILLAVAGRPQGVVLIDEIENGFHHDHLPSIWTMLLDICKQQDTQIFTSTHSQECLEAALPTVRKNEDEFALIRTEVKDGRCVARVFGGRQFHSAIEQKIEVR